jgi:hypothetical protein
MVIMRKMAASRVAIPASTPIRPLDAFVISSASLFTERLNAVSQLWQRNLRCEYVYDNTTGLDEQERVARESGARFIIRLKQDSYYITGLVDIIDVQQSSTRSVSRGEVADYVSTAASASKAAPVSASAGPVSAISVVAPEPTNFSKGRKEQQIRANFFSRLGMIQKKQEPPVTTANV